MNERTGEMVSLSEIEARIRSLIRDAVEFELVADNIDRPRADGSYDPRWYTAQGILTGFSERLGGVLYKEDA